MECGLEGVVKSVEVWLGDLLCSPIWLTLVRRSIPALCLSTPVPKIQQSMNFNFAHTLSLASYPQALFTL